MPSLTDIASKLTASVIDHSRRIHHQDQPWSVFDLVDAYADDNTGSIVVPEDQREWAWKHKKGLRKQEVLIDSVFYGYPIPSIILNKISRSHLQVYDGRHRIETLWRFFNDRITWNGYKYSQLCADDQRIFRERTLPVTVLNNASNEQLADAFIRLNSGSPLKDYDLLWARRGSPLVSATRRYVCENPRLSAALGGVDLNYRNDLGNWVGLVAGLNSWNAGNITTSFLRLSGDAGLGLNMEIREANIEEGIEAYCNLLETANTAYPATTKQKKELKKVGKIAAFFLHEWMNSDEQHKPEVLTKWVRIIGRLRGTREDRTAVLSALATPGAQNLTSSRIRDTIARVNAFLDGERVDAAIVLDEEDDDSDDSD